ncbi:alpha/beta hydrolase fold domain-containing protein [Nocardia sp. NPDC058518]|uniref:alpha/beta hydrolase fold domain-containing protein n=1 Tax=Nocardia sp. NPDC058518 TaxID=3346534 RepID=UPI003656D13D
MSSSMKLVGAFLWLTSRPFISTAGRVRMVMKLPARQAKPPRSLRRRQRVVVREAEGFAYYSVQPQNSSVDRVVMYLHGGAYIRPITRHHWALISRLADTGAQVEVPMYGLAPHHTYRQAYEFLAGVYRRIVTEFPGAAVIIAGDSAGGGLALGFTQSLASRNLPEPHHLILMAPWLDLTLADPDIAAVDDPWLSREGLIEAGKAWAGGDDPTDPRLSPLNGPVADLPPTDLYIGTKDLFHPDAVHLAEKASGHDAFSLVVCADALHVYPLLPTTEGRLAATEIVGTVANF